MTRTNTTTCHFRRFGTPTTTTTTKRYSSRLRPAILNTALALGLLGLMGVSRDAHAFYAVGKDWLWERRPMTNGTGGCRVPFTDELIEPGTRNTAYQVIDYINRHTTCRWEPKQSSDVNYVAVREEPAGPSQWFDWSSNAGGTGNQWSGRQQMSIYHGCENFEHLLHEMGHVMGLLHEHSRPDRDAFIEIFPSHIQGDPEVRQGFDIRWDGETLGFYYDAHSISHYSGWDFLATHVWSYPWCWFGDCRTMKLHNGENPGPIAQFFTAGDIEGLRRLYPEPRRLTAMHSGKCVTISGTNAQNLAVQWDCLHDGNQGWLFQWKETVGGVDYYTIESAWPGAKGMCLDVQNGSQNHGAPVWLWPCTGNHAQQWSRTFAGQNTNGYNLRARHSGQCVDVAWNSQNNGGQIVQANCSGTQNQIWGLNFQPTITPEPVDPCVPGQRSFCEYDPDLRRVICECLP